MPRSVVDLLKEEQLKHWDTVKWMVSDEARGKGRSTLLALAFIAEADRNLGRTVPLWDHYDTSVQTLRHTADRVAALLDQFKMDDPTWRVKEFEVYHCAPFTLKRKR